MAFNPYYESMLILSENEQLSYRESKDLQAVLEDVNSPVTRKLEEKLFQSVIDKKHINFGSIPLSKGNIKDYEGYSAMEGTLNTIKDLAAENKAGDVIKYVEIVQKAIENISGMSVAYQKGFQFKNEYIAMEYNSYVYFCVEATTALIYSFVEYVKRPDSDTLVMVIKNSKLRADEFYFEQLKKFNTVCDTQGVNYRKMLESMCTSKDNFIGTTAMIGMAAVMAAALAIIPVTRAVVYQVYYLRGNISEQLEIQAQFMEMNKTCVEANSALTVQKKKEIVAKQEKLVKTLRKLSDVIRVKSSKSVEVTTKETKNENKNLTIDSIKDEVSNSDFEFI
nr:MAG TPA: hypothetical protein [Caudoviricetes sp.]